MPRLSAIHEPILERLAEELRFAPKSALLKHIGNAQTLAAVIDPEQTYPAAWVIFRVTGFRPAAVDDDAGSGCAILESLSAFVEHLCEAAALTIEDVGPDALSPEQLCEKWGISRKSLDRARRKGLVAIRVRTTGPARTLLFTDGAVEAYEQRARPAPSPAGRRMTARTRGRILRRAKRYHDSLGYSANRAAQRLGPRFGFSPEAVRAAIKRSEADGAAIFSEIGPPTPREQAFAFRAMRRGLDPGVIASRLGRPRVTVWRAANAHRARLLHGFDLAGPAAPTFERSDAAEVLLNRPAVTFEKPPLLDEDLFAFMEQARAMPKPDARIEHDLALAMHFIRWRINRKLKTLPRSSHEATLLDEIETDLRLASRLKERLIAQTLPLLLGTMQKRLGHDPERLPPRSLTALSSAMLEAASRAVDRFDPTHGGRLAAPAGLALDRAAGHWLLQHTKKIETVGKARRALTRETAIGRIEHRFDPWQAWLEPDARIARILDQLDPASAEILDRRFGLKLHDPHTLTDLAAWLGIPLMHAARRERSALVSALARARGTILP
jgi:sigma-70-like protein